MTETEAAALKAMQDDICRERILRARIMTPEQRLADAFELTNGVFARMHEGAMWQLGTADAEAGWREVTRRLDRLRAAGERGRFSSQREQWDDAAISPHHSIPAPRCLLLHHVAVGDCRLGHRAGAHCEEL